MQGDQLPKAKNTLLIYGFRENNRSKIMDVSFILDDLNEAQRSAVTSESKICWFLQAQVLVKQKS